MANQDYQITTEQDRLIFRTSSFKAEKSSVLPSGVYTREFASMLCASAVTIFTYMIMDIINARSPLVRYGLLIIVFALSFLGADKYIFKERYLEAVFDRADRYVNIIRSGLLRKKSERISFNDIQSVTVGSKKFVPENIDGIDFVQKISAQHGSAVPGLGDVEEYITLSLKLTDGSERIIYSARLHGGKINGEPDIPLDEIRDFIGKST